MNVWLICSSCGRYLVSQAGQPDLTISVWRWEEEQRLASCKAPMQENFQISFSQGNFTRLTSCGPGHLTFWTLSGTHHDRLTHELGRFLLRPVASVESAVENGTGPDAGTSGPQGQGKVISTTHWGNLLVWVNGNIELEMTRKDGWVNYLNLLL